jgi:hypothetical protein
MNMIKYEDVEQKIINIRKQKVILDHDVAALYGVETKRVNEAVRRNLDKFPAGYLFELNKEEWELLKSQIATSIKGGKVKLPMAFTEKGLYMLATILKSPKATKTTLVIIDTFSKVREVSHIMNQLPAVKKDSAEQEALMHRAGDIISDLVVPDNFETEETDASIELNFAVVKFKYSVKKKAKK